MKRFFKLCLLFLFATALVWGYDLAVDRFSLRKIRSTWNIDNFEESNLPENTLNIQSILDQPFNYLGKGCQFYVFESLDHKYVLKFFKQKHLRPQQWLLELPLPHFLHQLSIERFQKKQAQIQAICHSCQLAYQALPHETGVLFLHLDKHAPFNKKIHLLNRLGLCHTINLSLYEWILQEKAIPAEKYFNELIKNGTDKQIAEAVFNICKSVKNRCAAGVCDKDPALMQNIGFTLDGEKVILMDFGQLVENDSLKVQENTQVEVQRRLSALKSWAENKCPALLSYL